jgi:hypothetical protein
MSISGDESSAELSEPSFPTLPDRGQHTERILIKRELREFLIINHTANVRKNSKISAIWHHEGERRRLDDKSLYRYWRCTYYISSIPVLKINNNSNN